MTLLQALHYEIPSDQFVQISVAPKAGACGIRVDGKPAHK